MRLACIVSGYIVKHESRQHESCTHVRPCWFLLLFFLHGVSVWTAISERTAVYSLNNVSSYCVDRTPPLPLVRHHHDRQVLVLVVVVVVPSLTRNAAVEIEVSPWVFRAPSTFALTAVCTRSRCFSVYLIPSRVHSCLHVSLCSPWLLCTIVSCPSVGGWWVVAGAVGRNDGNSGFVPLATCDLFASLHAPMMSVTSVRRGR